MAEQHFDLVIIGSGSGNSIPAEFDDWNIALVERDVFGGTCLNRGCIPSKMFVYAADVAAQAADSSKLGVRTSFDGVDWPAIVNRVFGRIDPIAEGGGDYRTNRCPNITVFAGSGHFADHKVLEVNGQRITAPQFLLAAGARPDIPAIEGLDRVTYHTSDTVMRLTTLPKRMVILGGGYIAAELGHVFGSFGTEVTYVLRGDRMLRGQDDDIALAATQAYAERFAMVTHAAHLAARPTGVDGALVLSGRTEGKPFEVPADVLLIATGRIPNGDDLGAAVTGVEMDGPRVRSDDTLRTNVDGIWALGDITNTAQLKHLANAEARVAFHNITTVGKAGKSASVDAAALKTIDRRFVPAAVFGRPQVASVGLTEAQASTAGLPYEVARQDFGGTAYGWAMEDSTSFCKLIVHAEDRTIIGAHIIGPQASSLIQPLIQGMQFGQTIDELARGVWYIHPALTEVIENALLQL